MAAGNSGFEAATNIVVARAMTQMLVLVYAAVGYPVPGGLPLLACDACGHSALGG